MLSTKDTTHIPFGIAPIGEMAPGVPEKTINRAKRLKLYFRTGIGEITPIGEFAPGVPKKEKEILF